MGYQESALVTGIFKDIPSTSTESFEFVISYPAWLEFSEAIGRRIYWGNYGPRTYALVDEETSINDFNQNILDFIAQKDPDLDATLMAVPYSSLYLYGNFENGTQQPGRILYVKLLSVVAIFIIVIACINFMNLSTARASRRL